MITHFKLHTRLSKVHSKHHRALVETEDGSKRNFDIRLRKDGWYIVLETGDDGPFTTVYQAFDVLNKWYVRPDEISPKVAESKALYITESFDGMTALVSSNKAVAPKRACDRYSDAEIDALFENITPDAVIEQALSYSDQSFDSLMGIYIRSTSEVEREAIRLVVMAEDWERHYSEYLDEVFYFVTRLVKVDGTLKQITWAKCFREDLRSDAIFARSVGDTELATFFDSMVDDLSALWIDTQAERSQYIRKQPRW